MTDRPIHLALASDDRGTTGLAVAVWSALRSTARPIHVWVIEDRIPRVAQDRLVAAWRRARADAEITFIPQSSLPLELPTWWTRSKWPLSSAARFQLAEILPAAVGRCIYLDIDVLVGTDLAELFELDLQGRPLGMALNSEMPEFDRAYVGGLGLDPDRYGNAGVLLIDVDAWRAEHAAKGLIDTGRRLPPDVWFFDQDMLNSYFKDRFLPLEARWNFRDAGVAPDGRIQHFAGSPKPWNIERSAASNPGLQAWHAACREVGYSPPKRSRWSHLKQRVSLKVAQIQRRCLTLLRSRHPR